MIAASHAGKFRRGHMAGHTLATSAVHIVVRVVCNVLHPFLMTRQACRIRILRMFESVSPAGRVAMSAG